MFELLFIATLGFALWTMAKVMVALFFLPFHLLAMTLKVVGGVILTVVTVALLIPVGIAMVPLFILALPFLLVCSTLCCVF